MKKLLKWYYGTASIRKKLVISYLVLVLLPLSILGVYSYRTARNNLLAQTRAAVKSNVSALTYNLQGNIQREDDNLKYLSYNVSFREKLENGCSNVTALAKEMNNSVERVFWYFITSDRNIKGIEVYTPNIRNAMGSFLKKAEDCAEEEWYLYHQEHFKSLWTYEEGKIYVTRPLLDASESSKPIGVMKLDVYPERFVEALSNSRYLDNGMVLLDRDDQVITARAVKNPEIEMAVREKIKGIEEAGIYETDAYILDAAETFENGWKLFYYVDKKAIAGDMTKILQTTLWEMGICLLVVTVLISIISKILTYRILKLEHCAEQVGAGNFHIVTEKGYTDEIGVVAQSFETMSRKIDEMMEQMYRLGMEKRATELKALQAMINPHFLYNCLSSIKWKAIRADQDEIADITGLLAKFYRTVLNDGRQITIVRNELENIRSYLEIQSRTHENGFDIIYKIPEEGMDYEMPNFLLQPIVENAVCHGVDYCPEGERGTIVVEYVPGEEFLEFRVYNNGPNLTDEQLKKILSEPNSKGYGIYNIQERINMYYDETCGLFARVMPDGMICFTVKILKNIKDRFGESV